MLKGSTHLEGQSIFVAYYNLLQGRDAPETQDIALDCGDTVNESEIDVSSPV